jgi:hypothetical protein
MPGTCVPAAPPQYNMLMHSLLLRAEEGIQ